MAFAWSFSNWDLTLHMDSLAYVIPSYNVVSKGGALCSSGLRSGLGRERSVVRIQAMEKSLFNFHFSEWCLLLKEIWIVS